MPTRESKTGSELFIVDNSANLQSNLRFIRETLDQTEYTIRVMQRVLDQYNIHQFKTTVRKEGNFEEIFSWLAEKDYTTALGQIRSEPSALSDSQ